MLRRGAVRSIVALALMVAATPAAAQELEHVPSLDSDKALMEVKVPSAALYGRLFSSYDFQHPSQRNGDGSISTDVLVNAEERALLRAQGVQFVRTLENDATTDARSAERDAAVAAEVRARTLARTGASARQGKSAVGVPGEVVIQRAYTFTNYAGRFLYVEAHTKAATPTTSPTLMLTSAGADGVYGAASEMPILRDPDPNLVPLQPYMYHRHLVRVTGVEPKTVRVASSAGGVDQAPVTEWVGTTRPPHAAGYLTGLLQPLHGPDRDHRPLRLARGRVRRPRRHRRPPEPDPRLPPQRADGHGRQPRRAVRRPGRQLQRGRRPAGRDPRVRGLGERGRQRPVRDLPQPGRGELAADRDRGRQRAPGRPGDRRDRRAVEHRGAGRERDQRQRRRRGQAEGLSLPRLRDRRDRHRPGDAAQPRCRTCWPRPPTSSARRSR